MYLFPNKELPNQETTSMKKSIVILIPLLLLSCQESSPVRKNKDAASAEPNVIENIKEKSSDPFQKAYRTNAGMVEDIYNQLIINDKALSKLDTQIKNLNTNTSEVIAAYESVLANSTNYYDDAKIKSGKISDSLLQREINNLMTASAQKYSTKTANVQSYIAAAKKNISTVNDQYMLYKIYKTLPEIEKYQNTNSFDLQNLNTLISEQNKVLSTLLKQNSLYKTQ